MSVFCLGGFAGGFAAKKIPVRILLPCAALLILLGFFLASRLKSIAELYIFYGVFCGFGVGIGYNSVMSSVLKWFPDKLGVLSGVLLMGFGFGGMVLGSAAVFMMTAWGWRVTFRILGIALASLIVLASLLFRKPPEGFQADAARGAKNPSSCVEDVPASRMVRDRSFWGYFLWAVILSSVGLAVIANALPMARGITANLALATFIAGLINICNGLGRLSLGFLFDSIGSKRCFFLISGGLLLAVVILLASFAAGSPALLCAGFVLAGLSFGGITSCNSAYASKVFGQKYYAINFSIITMQLLVSSFLGPYSAGLMQTKFGGYSAMLIMLVIFCVAAVPFLLLIKRHASILR
jgi:OFA family oxalate/formate antiporter-like MFS transporter